MKAVKILLMGTPLVAVFGFIAWGIWDFMGGSLIVVAIVALLGLAFEKK